MTSIEVTTISWHRVQSSEDIHYENASTEEFHQLNLNYSVSGQLEIAVTFSGACEKTSAIEYTGEPVFLCRISCVALLDRSLLLQLKVC